MLDKATVRAVGLTAARLKVETNVLLAVVEVESAGKVYALLNGRQEPLIRFEGHYFDRLLEGKKRERARKEGLAHPAAGGVKNPSSQAARWRMLKAAMAIDEQAALESTSWGIGQVMGAHWEALGYASVQAMVAAVRKDVAGQIAVMARYIEEFGLADELRRKDFTAFARGYNGPGYARNGYHTKMAAAYARLSGKKPVSAAASMLRMGSKGARVRELQALLVRAGYAVKVDGDYGPSTKAAVTDFQRENKLAVDGVAGPETMRALAAFKVAPEEEPGAVGPFETEEAKQGGAAVVTGAGIETARQQIDSAADRLADIPGLEWLSGTLTIVAVLLVLGGLSWAAYGWWKSRQTDEGDAAPAGA
ncbi:N-acetylmuramidase domain-containing protein [Chelativorans sp.]|uniref:N-acetylmuramidase domain-containing protein n=1 Tax=Chelativorans sp. TaxID=2203393 RepID=UPI0028113177|nr:N-acetylmuramidase domain-containing protein [Chelativorans sp.]